VGWAFSSSGASRDPRAGREIWKKYHSGFETLALRGLTWDLAAGGEVFLGKPGFAVCS
jgi:hypothetical protein